jgi:hypothetical protein
MDTVAGGEFFHGYSFRSGSTSQSRSVTAQHVRRSNDSLTISNRTRGV